MLYTIVGTDIQKTAAKRGAFLAALKKKRPDAELFSLTTLNWSESAFEEKAFAQGLFERKIILILNGLFSEKASRDYLLPRIESLAALDHALLVIETELEADVRSALTAVAEDVYEFNKKISADDAPPNLFPLADALGARDKKQLWVRYQQALRDGSSAEEIHGVLMWQVRSMLVASSAQSAEEAKLKPFVYSKSKRYAGNFPGNELQQLSEKLLLAYHYSRRGEGSMVDGIEEALLKV